MHAFPRSVFYLSLAMAFATLGFLVVFASSAQGAASTSGTSSATTTSRPATRSATSSRPTTRSTRAATTTAPAAPKVVAPASISELAPAALKLFDAASGNDWAAAAKQSTAFADALQKVKADLPKPIAAQQTRLTQLTNHITTINTAITGKQRQAAMNEANRMLRVSGVLADTFINKVPQNVWQMEYLAREMLVWSAEPVDLVKLKALPARIDTEWALVSKEVTTKGGDVMVKEFTDETAKLKTAATADDFVKLTKPMLDTLDKIEKAYLK